MDSHTLLHHFIRISSLAQCAHTVRRLSDIGLIQLWKRAEIFMRPTYILTKTLSHYQKQNYVRNKQITEGTLRSLFDNSLIESRFNSTLSFIQQAEI